MARKKSKRKVIKAVIQDAPEAPAEDQKWKVRRAAETIMEYEELREDKKLFSRASNRLKSAARHSGRA